MNIPSYSWAGQHAFGEDGRTEYDVAAGQWCGLSACYGDLNVPDGPERYRDAYRHVHNLAAPLAPNIAWVWNPNARNWPLASVAPWNDYNEYYPGDDYVDWVGLDGYNWGPNSGNGYGRWVSFDEMFGAELRDLAARYPTQRQMIPEIGAVEDPADPNRKANFIRDTYQAYARYPLLQIIIWVQDDKFWDAFRQPPGPADFRVNSSPQALQAYQQAIAPLNSGAPRP
jgi:beta-mannanase